MFEKFTREARAAVVQSQDVAKRLGADRCGAEHVLLGALEVPASVAARAAARLGVDAAAVESALRALPADRLDADALAGLGIDLDAVRAHAEQTFGPGALDGVRPASGRSGHRKGHVPFDASGKKLLEIALREAVRLKQNRIDSGHLLLAVARLDDTDAHRVLAGLGAGRDDVRQAVVAAWSEAPAA